MAGDSTTSREGSIPIEGDSQPPALPSIVEPDEMDKLLRYAVRRGLYAATYMSMFYKTLSALHVYSSSNIDDADFTSTFSPAIFRSMLGAVRVTVAIKGGKAAVSMQATLLSPYPLPSPLKRWLDKYSVTESREAEIKSKEQLLGLVLAFSMFRNFFVVVGSLPMSILTGLTRNLSATLRAARSVPALIAILIVMFATGDAWRLFGLESVWRCSILLAIIVAVAVLVMTTGVRGWMTKDGWPSVIGYPADKGELVLAKWVQGTSVEGIVNANIKPQLPIDDHLHESLREASNILGRSAGKLSLKKNVNILLGITVVANVIAIFFWVSLAFITVGIIVVSESATKELTGGPIDVIWHASLLGQSFAITKELLFVSMVLGAIAALTFSAASIQDASSRQTFSEYALSDVRHALGAYAYYVGGVVGLINVMAADGTLNLLKNIDFKAIGAMFDAYLNRDPNNPE
jgi:hypothetical protein